MIDCHQAIVFMHFKWTTDHQQISTYLATLFHNIYITGFAAGSYYGNTGGGVNYQCLHTEPEYNTSYSSSGSFSVISGAEYESSKNYGIFPSAAFQQNVPCARCYTQRSAVVMIPSRRSCPTGWSKEYEGKNVINAVFSYGFWFAIKEVMSAVSNLYLKWCQKRYCMKVIVQCKIKPQLMIDLEII